MKIVNTSKMGNILGVTSHTVLKMARRGAIPYGRYSTYGPYRFSVEAVLKALGLDAAQGDEAAYSKHLKETNNAVLQKNRDLSYENQALMRKVEKLESILKNINEVLNDVRVL
jgi:hypothetical protein